MQRISEALLFAARKHKDQRRKDASKTPYINHPIEVFDLLCRAGVTDVDVLIAGILHDTVEDTNTTAQELETIFGKRVAALVMEVTDEKKLPKVVRKKLQIEHAKHTSMGAGAIKLADKYSNLNDVMNNPPANWSHAELIGYVVWAYAVVRELLGTNEYLEEKLANLFHCTNVGDGIFLDRYFRTDITECLESYYRTLEAQYH